MCAVCAVCVRCAVCGVCGVCGVCSNTHCDRLGKSVNVYDDVFGRIFLDSLDPQDVWYRVLNAVDMDLVYDRCAPPGHRRTAREIGAGDAR